MPFQYDINPTIQTKVDGIFEGGGTLGAAYIGSLLAMHRQGIWFERVAGNSAGAITASLIAVGYNANEIDWLTAPSGSRIKPNSIPDSVTPISFRQFIDRPLTNDIRTRQNSILWHLLKGTLFDSLLRFEVPLPPLDRFIADAVAHLPGSLAATVSDSIREVFQRYPSSITVRPAALSLTEEARREIASQLLDQFLNLSADARSLANLACDGGLVKGDEFLAIIRRLLKAKRWGNPDDRRDVTFADLPHDLVLIASNITKGEPIIFSKLRTPTHSVAEAVRQSMAVPFFFEPFRLPNGDEVVDGGLVENFPWWVFFPLDSPYPQPGGSPVSSGTSRLEVNMPRAVRLAAAGQGLRADIGNNGITRTSSADVDRPKIAFFLDEDAVCPPSYNCPAETEEMELLDALRESRVLDFDIGEAVRGTGQATRAFRTTAEAKLIERFSQVNRISAKPLINSMALGLAAERYPNLHLNSIPLAGFCWLDFTINENRGKFNRCAARGWEATRRLISAKNLAPSIGELRNPYLQ